tara:strand:- start:3304 stop:4467 length:1164 start_codon:yes stop_codon:yes gene_type:complete
MNKYPMTVRVEDVNGKLVAVDSNGNDVTDLVSHSTRKKAIKFGTALYKETETSKFRQIPLESVATTSVPVADEPIEVPSEQAEIMNFISNSYSLKPESLVMKELKWKYLIRSAVRGRNIMMTGPAGCGKTMAAKSLVNSLDRPDFYFNLGATQDPRATLIGNTHFDKDKGTYFSEALFVKAIQTPNAVILLDELTRAHPDAWNILMTVLDQGQRYLRLDEAQGQATIEVADGVTFIATANIGNEYTATRTLDKALLDRFIVVEMDLLTDSEEAGLLQYMFPNVDSSELGKVAEIAHLTRLESLSESGRFTSGVSTRTSVEIAGLLYDGFSLSEAAEVCIYPQYSADGGADSERTFVKQLVQKYVGEEGDGNLFNDVEDEDGSDNVRV